MSLPAKFNVSEAVDLISDVRTVAIRILEQRVAEILSVECSSGLHLIYHDNRIRPDPIPEVAVPGGGKLNFSPAPLRRIRHRMGDT